MKILNAKIAALTLTLLLLCSSLAAQESYSTPPHSSDNQATSASSESPDAGPGESNVRIVRLSETTGEVNVYRGLGHGYETALLNLPITQGLELRTGEGFAEEAAITPREAALPEATAAEEADTPAVAARVAPEVEAAGSATVHRESLEESAASN